MYLISPRISLCVYSDIYGGIPNRKFPCNLNVYFIDIYEKKIAQDIFLVQNPLGRSSSSTEHKTKQPGPKQSRQGQLLCQPTCLVSLTALLCACY